MFEIGKTHGFCGICNQLRQPNYYCNIPNINDGNTINNNCFYEHDTIHESRGSQENCQAWVKISVSKVSK